MVELKKQMANKLLDSVRAKDDVTGEIYYEIDLLSRDDLIQTFVEIEAVTTDDFLKIKETLSRVGIANRKKKELHPSCLILHKKGKYYITHFLELYGLDAKETEMTLDDYARRNHIAKLLESWNLIKIANRDIMYSVIEETPINVYVLPFKDKKDWKICNKYNIGEIKEYIKEGNK